MIWGKEEVMSTQKKTVFLFVASLFFMSNFQLIAMHNRQYDVELGSKQKAQLGLSLLKTAVEIWADTNNVSEVGTTKCVALAKILASFANVATKALDYSREMRDGVSVGFHVNACVWQIAKDIEEYIILTKLQQYYEDTLPDSVAAKYYVGMNQNNELDDFEENEPSVKNRSKLFLRLLELGVSCWLACGRLTPIQRNVLIIGQGVCDLLLRYVCNDKNFISPSWIGKIEAVSSTVSSGYDIARSAYNLTVLDAKAEQPPKRNDVCPSCGKKYCEIFGNLACQMMNCKHWCCMDCAKKHQKEIVLKTKTGYFAGENELDDEIVRDMKYKKFARREVSFPKVVSTCPVCQVNNQTFKPTHLPNPKKKIDADGTAKGNDSFCTICMENDEKKKKKKLACSHKFCFDCIKGWHTVNQTCPICRESFML